MGGAAAAAGWWVAAAADIERQSLKSVPSLDLLSPISSSGASFIREMQGQNIPACVMTCSPAARSWSSPSAAASGDSRHTQRERGGPACAAAKPPWRRSRHCLARASGSGRRRPQQRGAVMSFPPPQGESVASAEGRPDTARPFDLSRAATAEPGAAAPSPSARAPSLVALLAAAVCGQHACH